jgi:hypothetical protein
VFAQPAERVATPEDHRIEVYVAENALQAMYVTTLDTGKLGTNEVQGGFFFSEERDFVLIGDMLVDVGERERHPRWRLNVGPRAYGAQLNVENQDVFAIAVGGRLSYMFRQNGATTLSVSAFYAPDIATFGSADNTTDISVRFETRLTAATRIFVGYRSLEFALLDASRRIDDSAHIGIQRRF